MKTLRMMNMVDGNSWKALVVTSLVIIGCTKTGDFDNCFNTKHFVAYIDDNAETKVQFGNSVEDGYQLLWEDNDQIIIASGNTYGENAYYSVEHGGANSCTFVLDDGEIAPSSGPFSALFPSNLFYTVQSDGAIIINYPSSIPYSSNGVTSGFYPMISQSNNSSLFFRNILGILEIDLFSEQFATISSVVLSSPLDSLAGKFLVSFNDGDPIISFISGNKQLEMICNSVALSTEHSSPTKFMIPIPPKEDGYDLFVTITGKVGANSFESTLHINKNKTKIHRGKITKMPTLQFDAMVSVTQKEINIYKEVTPSSFECENHISVMIGGACTSTGICWSTSNNPTINDNCIVSASSSPIVVDNLKPNTVYYERPFAQRGGLTYYGSSMISVKTANSEYAYSENGVLVGYGVEIDGVVWAPVNCGYIGPNNQIYRYGKIYQWGRKQGQGAPISSAAGPFPKPGSQDDFSYVDENGNIVYVVNAVTTVPKANTLYSPISRLADWRTDDSLVVAQLTAWEKTNDSRIGDPCPDGWRIPNLQDWKTLDPIKNNITYDGEMGELYVGIGDSIQERNYLFLPHSGQAFLALLWPSIDMRIIWGNQNGPRHYWSSMSYVDKWYADNSTYHVSNAYSTYDDNISRDVVMPYVTANPIRCVKE